MTRHITLDDLTARWPALLKDDAAATYCGVSISHYRAQRAKGLAPAQIDFGGRKLTRRSDLDALIASMPSTDEGALEEERSAADEAFG